MSGTNIRKSILFTATSLMALGLAGMAQAQNATDAFKDEIIVTATKKAGGENVQDVAIAMTVLGADQLDALKIRDISGLSFKMPNVALDDIGTARGTANFSIRGLGINSSIPSIDPTVGVFVDGMYLGVNNGVIFDTFDLESIEVLRGPQGVLFGRNVTGGAVVLNTADPSFDYNVKAKFAVESGLRGTGNNYYAMGTITGPIVKDKIAAKLGVYYNNDEGWFKHAISRENFGKSDTFIIRPSLLITPTSNSEIIIKFEHGTSGGDGPIGQSHTNGSGVDGQVFNFDRNSFRFAIDERGFTDVEWNHVIVETNIDVEFGDGTITNIFAWRELNQSGTSDIDSTPLPLFHADFATDQDQVSNELRYAGSFGNTDVTTGFFYFTQDLGYDEVRNLLGALTPTGAPALRQHGGGIQDHETWGVFTNFDFHVSDALTFSPGIRYTEETKAVTIASLFRNINSPCSVIGGTCPFDFVDNLKTTNWSPSIVGKYEVNDELRIYSSWKRAYRAGGYNFRNTSPVGSPGPFGDEKVDTIELGFKSEPGGNAKLNGNVFYTKINNMQREVNLASSGSGVVQIIRNTGSAEIYGIEVDGQVFIGDNIVLDGSIGYLDGSYKTILFDISGDGVINDTDLGLDIPRLSPFTASFGVLMDNQIGDWGVLSTRVNFSHRDQSAYTDNNLGILNAADRLDGSLAFTFNEGRSTLSLYGKNLTNNVQHGNDTQLPALLGPIPLGGTFAPLSKGRVIGIELNMSLN